MKHVSAAMAAAVVACMLLPSLIFADGSDAEDGETGTETGQTYISGYIYEPRSSGNEPIEGVTVTVKMTLSERPSAAAFSSHSARRSPSPTRRRNWPVPK